MFLPSRAAVSLLLSLCSWAIASGTALAQDYPNKPIKIVVPFPAGGSSDATGRLIADKLGQVLKASVVVDNKGGAGGIIGTDFVAKSAPDGYTLVLVDVFHSSTPIYTRKMPYDAVKDFTPISLVGKSPAFLVSSATMEAKTVKDVFAFARANPGKLRLLATTGARRHPDFPDAPTLAEVDIKGVDYEQWFGILGPANLPKPITDKLANAIAQVLQMPDVREKLAGLALEHPIPGAAEMQAKVESDTARWAKLAKELDIKPLD